MGNNASSLQSEPKLKISGPTDLVTNSLVVKKLLEQDNEKPTEKFIHPCTVSQPMLSTPEIHHEQKPQRNSLVDPKLLPKIPRISFNFEGYDMTLFKQIEAHATAAPAIDNIQTAFLYSGADYDASARVEPYEELAEVAVAAVAAAAAAAATEEVSPQDRREVATPTTSRQPTRPSSPQSLRHKNSSSSLLSFKSMKSKASLTSLRSKVSDATFELVTLPGSIDSRNGERQSIVVTKKTRVLYDGRKGEWQFDGIEAKAAEPEPELRGKYMRRVLRSSR